MSLKSTILNKFLVILILIGLKSFAQNQPNSSNVDILEFSRDQYNLNSYDMMGTSRTLGLSGAQSVIGADPGSLYHNPASGGLFRKSVVSITPSFGSVGNELTFQNTSSVQKSPYGILNNVALIFATTDDSKTKGFKNYTLGVTFNRVATYFENGSVSATNDRHSYTNYLGERTTEIELENPSKLTSKAIVTPTSFNEIAWKSALIDFNPTDSTYFGIVRNGGVQQTITYEKTGFLNSWNFNASTNYEDFLYIGLGLDANQYQYNSAFELAEEDIYDSIANFNRFVLLKNYSSSGTGLGFNLGVIAKPVSFWRIGAAFKSGINYEVFSIEDFKLEEINLQDSAISDVNNKSYELLGEEQVNIRKQASSITIGNYFQVKKYGFLTFDFNYKMASSIDSSFNNVLRFAIGGEYRKGIIRARSGFGFSNHITQNDVTNTFWSLGAGVYKGPYFFDFAFNKFNSLKVEEPYQLNEFFNDLTIKNKQVLFSITTGVKF